MKDIHTPTGDAHWRAQLLRHSEGAPKFTDITTTLVQQCSCRVRRLIFNHDSGIEEVADDISINPSLKPN